MKIPTYLYLALSGVWHYRQRFGRRTVERSLHTADFTIARLLALSYAVAMKKEPPQLAGILDKSGRDYIVERSQDGAFTVKADRVDDHARAMDAFRTHWDAFYGLRIRFRPGYSAKVPPVPIAKAVRLYLAEVKPPPSPRLSSSRRRALKVSPSTTATANR